MPLSWVKSAIPQPMMRAGRTHGRANPFQPRTEVWRLSSSTSSMLRSSASTSSVPRTRCRLLLASSVRSTLTSQRGLSGAGSISTSKSAAGSPANRRAQQHPCECERWREAARQGPDHEHRRDDQDGALAAEPLGEARSDERSDHGTDQDPRCDHLLPPVADIELLSDLQERTGDNAGVIAVEEARNRRHHRRRHQDPCHPRSASTHLSHVLGHVLLLSSDRRRPPPSLTTIPTSASVPALFGAPTRRAVSQPSGNK